MELQRCIWRCLSASPGASSPQYNQCVEHYCVETPSPAQTAAAPMFTPAPSDWTSGVASDGVHRYATTPAAEGYTWTYFCMPGYSYVVLGDVPVPPGQYRMQIGQTDFLVTLNLTRGVLSADIPADNVFVQAMRRGGDQLTVRSLDGVNLVRFSLRGADQHIGQAIAGCGG